MGRLKIVTRKMMAKTIIKITMITAVVEAKLSSLLTRNKTSKIDKYSWKFGILIGITERVL